MKKFLVLLLCIIPLSGVLLFSQNVGINNDASQPHNSAMLDVKSTDKGILIPRMTLTQRNAITSPASGLMIYQTDNAPGFYYYNGSSWAGVANRINAYGTFSTENASVMPGQEVPWFYTNLNLNIYNFFLDGLFIIESGLYEIQYQLEIMSVTSASVGITVNNVINPYSLTNFNGGVSSGFTLLNLSEGDVVTLRNLGLYPIFLTGNGAKLLIKKID